MFSMLPTEHHSFPSSLLMKHAFIQVVSSKVLKKVGPSSSSIENVDRCMLNHGTPILLAHNYFSSSHMIEDIFVVEILEKMYLA